jgi:hypothetical protein
MQDIRELYQAAGMMNDSGQMLSEPMVQRLIIELEVIPVGVEFDEFGQTVISFETRMRNSQKTLPFGRVRLEDPNFNFKLPLDQVVLKTD